MPIVLAPNPILTFHCYTLPPPWQRDRSLLADELLTYLQDNPGAVGIAAPQLGHGDRAFAFRPAAGGTLVVFNPLVVPSGYTKQAAPESCLSLPGQSFLADRYRSVFLSAESVDGDPIRRAFVDIDARVIQHEVDHLNGLLIHRFKPAPEEIR